MQQMFNGDPGKPMPQAPDPATQGGYLLHWFEGDEHKSMTVRDYVKRWPPIGGHIWHGPWVKQTWDRAQIDSIELEERPASRPITPAAFHIPALVA